MRFFVLVFVLAIPFWVLGALVAGGLPLAMSLPVSALQFVCPLIAALILVHRERGRRGVATLLRRLVDPAGIKAWFVPALLVMPGIYLLSYLAMRVLGRPLPEPRISLVSLPILLVVFFIAAAGEEGGWSGYAVDPMQRRRTALTAAVILGLVWGLFHVVPDIQAHRDAAWIVWQRGGLRRWAAGPHRLAVQQHRQECPCGDSGARHGQCERITVPQQRLALRPRLHRRDHCRHSRDHRLLWGPRTLARFKLSEAR